jgi:hypothetical protein
MTTIVLCHFTLTTDIYSMMAEKCKQSIQDNMPNAIIKELVLQPDKKFKRTIDEAFYANLIKLKAWSENIEGNTIFLDADTIVLEDLSHVFENDFDIAYTGRKGNIKFNSGVVFVKDSGKDAVKAWYDVCERMFADRKFWHLWARKCYGYNQAAFAYLLENYPFKKLELLSYIYNSCDVSDWINRTEDAKVFHIKSDLRMDMLKREIKRYPKAWERMAKYYT